MWWNDLTNIKKVIGVGVGRWINNNLRLELGDGVSTLFWWDLWLDGWVWVLRLTTFFYFSDNKMTSMPNKAIRLGWGGEAWKWRKRLWVWEEDLLGECFVVLCWIQLFCRRMWLIGSLEFAYLKKVQSQQFL